MGSMTEQEIAELFARPLDPDTEERALREELDAMMRRHRAAAKPIVDRIVLLQARKPTIPVIPVSIVRADRMFSRKAKLFRAVLNRIERMGDMPIRVRGRTFATILAATGFDTDTFDAEPYREVEAAALEALIRKAAW